MEIRVPKQPSKAYTRNDNTDIKVLHERRERDGWYEAIIQAIEVAKYLKIHRPESFSKVAGYQSEPWQYGSEIGTVTDEHGNKSGEKVMDHDWRVANEDELKTSQKVLRRRRWQHETVLIDLRSTDGHPSLTGRDRTPSHLRDQLGKILGLSGIGKASGEIRSALGLGRKESKDTKILRNETSKAYELDGY